MPEEAIGIPDVLGGIGGGHLNVVDDFTGLVLTDRLNRGGKGRINFEDKSGGL